MVHPLRPDSGPGCHVSPHGHSFDLTSRFSRGRFEIEDLDRSSPVFFRPLDEYKNLRQPLSGHAIIRSLPKKVSWIA